MEQNNDVQNMNTPNEVTQSRGSLNEQTPNNSEPKSPKFNMLFIILLIVSVLGLAGYIVYDKVINKPTDVEVDTNNPVGGKDEETTVKLDDQEEAETPVGETAPSSAPLNASFKTSEACADKTSDMFIETGIYFKPAKTLSVNRTSLVKSSYALQQAVYCYDEECAAKESDLLETYKETAEMRKQDTTKTSDFYDLKVTIANGVATAYLRNYENSNMVNAVKLDVQNVKGVKATFDCAGDGPYGILVLDGSNNLYMYTINSSNDKYTLNAKRLIYKNVKDYEFVTETADIFPLYDGCWWERLAVHTSDGKSLLVDFNDEIVTAVNLNSVSELTAYMDTGINVGEHVYVSSSSKNTYQKYNGKEIKVKGLFVQNAKQKNDNYDYKATIHLVTENNEHLYFRYDDCEHKYRPYTNGKVKSLTYDTNRKKAIMTYTDGNKVEFDYSDKIEF